MEHNDVKELYSIILAEILAVLAIVSAYAFSVERNKLSGMIIIAIIAIMVCLYLLYVFNENFRRITLILSIGNILIASYAFWKTRWMYSSEHSQTFMWLTACIYALLILNSLLMIIHYRTNGKISLTAGFILLIIGIIVSIFAFALFPSYDYVLSCGTINESNAKESCWTNKALMSEDSKNCDNIRDIPLKELCYALTTKDTSYCYNSKNRNETSYCISMVNKDKELCSSLPENYSTSCNTYIEYS